MQVLHTRALPWKNAETAGAPGTTGTWRKIFIGGQRLRPNCSRLQDCSKNERQEVKKGGKKEGKEGRARRKKREGIRQWREMGKQSRKEVRGTERKGQKYTLIHTRSQRQRLWETDQQPPKQKKGRQQ